MEILTFIITERLNYQLASRKSSAHFLSTLRSRVHLLLFVYIFQRQPWYVFYKKEVFKNFAQHRCQSLTPVTFLKKDSSTGAFPEFCNIFKNTIFTEVPRAIASDFCTSKFFKICHMFSEV